MSSADINDGVESTQYASHPSGSAHDDSEALLAPVTEHDTDNEPDLMKIADKTGISERCEEPAFRFLCLTVLLELLVECL